MTKKRIVACICSCVCVLSSTACTLGGKSTLLAEPIPVEALQYSEQTKEDFVDFKSKVNGFSSAFSQSVYQAQVQTGNFAISPISVFMALSLATECTAGNTKTELLSALNLDETLLRNNLSKLYRSLEKEYKSESVFGKKITGKLHVTNSIWIDESVIAKPDCLHILSKDYYCYAYSADFLKDTASANKALQNFVKKQMQKKINRDFNLSNQTLFSLINTLYLKDIWNFQGDDLSLTENTYEFHNQDGSVSSKKLLKSYYNLGRKYQTDTYSYFYADTYHNYKIKLIVPNDGYTIGDVFTQETLSTVNSVKDFNAEDEENLLRYHTRCLFPEYSASYYGDVKTILQNDFGIQDLFSIQDGDFTPLTDEKAVCDGVIHASTLEVNRKGIEGAAITVIPGAGAPGPDEYTDVFENFVVDKAFAFLITDPYDVTLFSGVIEKL